MSACIGYVAEKILQLARQQSGPISVKEINERLAEPIGLLHLGISQLVRQEKIDVVTWARRNFIIVRSPPVAVRTSEQLATV